MFVGIDWASEEHAVCVLDDAGRKVSSFTIEHTADGFEELVRKLRKLDDPDQLSVCLLYTSPSPRDRTRSRMPSSA